MSRHLTAVVDHVVLHVALDAVVRTEDFVAAWRREAFQVSQLKLVQCPTCSTD